MAEAEIGINVDDPSEEIPVPPQPFIYRVHPHLREINPDAYEPNIIAIGPYHRSKPKLKMMEEHKRQYLNLLLRRKNETIDIYNSAVSGIEKQAREAYSEPVRLCPEKFIAMLVLDGCFIIELVSKFNRRDPSCDTDPIFRMEWMMNSSQRDLMLFENQIPFFVLCKIYDLIEAPNQHQRLAYLLLGFFKNLELGAGYMRRTDRKVDEIKHLLDLIHGSWNPEFRQPRKKLDWRFIHSVTELKEANVRFHNKKSAESLFQIDFTNGVLNIPTLTIEDRTESFIRNLIAYEQYHPVPDQNFIINYITFLDCLINSSKDVEILTQKQIIDNWLGENEVVANIINKITDSVTGPGQHFAYAEVFDEVNKYSGRRVNRNMAILRRDYFNSPWTIISFIAAVILLVLTVVSTVFTGIQTFHNSQAPAPQGANSGN